MWTQNPDGEKIELFCAPDDRSEAIHVAQQVRALESDTGLDEMAVLYRTNAQSRQLEEVFRRDRIPYQIVGSVQFYERKEVKDLLAYVKLAVNPSDDVSFRRIVNTPPRGIGQTTLRGVEEVARTMGLPLMEAAGHTLEQGLVASRSAGRLRGFLDFVAELLERADERPAADLIEHLVESIDYAAHLEKNYGALAGERMENVQALVSAAVEYAEESEDGSLAGFLDRSALVAGADELRDLPGVTLMTIHCAKGLEFPVVFLVGLDEGVFPHAMAGDSLEEIEEERRLCYVAMTRARRLLRISHARLRRLQGALIPHPPSRFIEEIPAERIREILPPDAGFFDESPVRGRAGEGSSAARVVRPHPARRDDPPLPARQPLGPPPEDGFTIGALVRHPRFGGGTILDREGRGKHLKLTIRFADHGSKKILPAYTKLLIQTG